MTLFMVKLWSSSVFCLVFFLCSCSLTVQPSFERLEPDRFPTFYDDLDRASLKTAAQQSLTALRGKNDAETLAFGQQHIAIARIRESLTAFLAVLDKNDELQAALQRDFELYRVARPVLFTGYHEPLLRGSRVRTPRFRYPIYRRPDDLVEIDSTASPGAGKQFGSLENGQVTAYFSREDIDEKEALSGKQYELFWVDDPVSLFFLHIQGSGQILLPDGVRVRIGYAASNGRPYQSIGKLLLEQGKLNPGQATTPAIRRYLQAHPEEQRGLFYANPRYIFFQITADSAGPRGSLGVPLTPGRSLAVDPKIYPSGALGLIRTRRPVTGPSGEVLWRDFSRFVFFQDTGAAITGWRRADIFWGAEAEDEAGLMAQEGEMYLIVKKP
jgi:membrane-bound lytic murein transglycosylase A